MGLTIDEGIFPPIPTAPGPGALSSPIPGQQEREEGALDLAREQAQPGFQQIAEQAPAPPPQPEQLDFNSILAAGGKPRSPEPTGLTRPPDREKTFEEITKESNQMVEDVLNDLSANLGDTERAAAETEIEAESPGALLDQLEEMLGPRAGPAPGGEPPAGVSDDELLQIATEQADKADGGSLGDLPEIQQTIFGPGGIPITKIGTGFTVMEGESPTESIKRNFLEFWDRFRSGLGRTKKEQIAPFIGAYGRKNVRMKSGEIEIRRPGDKGFRPVDSDKFEFFGDIFADLSGPILETAIGAAAEVGILLTAASATAGSGGLAAPVAIPALIGAGAAGGAAGSAGREGAIRAIDSFSDQKQLDEDFDLKSDILWSAGIGAASFGAAGLLKGGIKAGTGFLSSKLKPLINDFVSRSPIKRAESIGKILNSLDVFLGRMGAKPEFGPAGVGATLRDPEGFSRAARDAHGVIEDTAEQLSKDVQLIRNEVIQKGGKRKFAVTTALAKQEQILANSDRIIFDPKTGEALLTRESTSASLTESARASIGASRKLATRNSLSLDGASAVDDVSAALSTGVSSAERRALTAATPQATPDKALSEMAAQYNLLLKCQRGQGGCSAATIFNTVDTFADLAGSFKGNVNLLKVTAAERKARGEWAKAANALRSDRDAMVDSLVGEFPAGSPINKHWKQAFERFHKNIDQLTDFTAEFEKAGSARAWAEVIFRPKNGKQIRQLRDSLGSDSPQWKALKGEWMADMMRNATDASSGLLNASRFRRGLNKFQRDPEVMDLLMTKPEQKQMLDIVDGLAEISTDDLVGPRKIRNWVKDMLLLWQNVLPTTRATIISTYLTKNTRMTPELINNIQDALRTAPLGKSEKLGWMSTINTFRAAIDSMGIVKVKRINPKTGKKVEIEIFVPVRPIARAKEVGARGIRRSIAEESGAAPALAEAENQPPAELVAQ